jgi:predicted NAD/FAD-dependent oxidoreductase
MTALAKHLGAGLDIRRETRIVALSQDDGALRATAEDGQGFVAKSVVVALPAEQARALTGPLRDPALAPLQTMLSWFASDPALTVLAGYPLSVPAPGFDLLHPDDASVVQLVVHDSAKRSAPHSRTLVFHASPVWSRRHFDVPREDWAAALLEAAGTLLGDWAAAPSWTSTHRWRYARVPSGLGLNAPLVTTLQCGATLALAGEAFDDHGGLEGAWRSGRRAAELLPHPGSTP